MLFLFLLEMVAFPDAENRRHFILNVTVKFNIEMNVSANWNGHIGKVHPQNKFVSIEAE